MHVHVNVHVTHLNLIHITDSMIEFDRSSRARSSSQSSFIHRRARRASLLTIGLRAYIRILLARKRRRTGRNTRSQTTCRSGGNGILERVHASLLLLMHRLLLLLADGVNMLLLLLAARRRRRGWPNRATTGAENHLCASLPGLRRECAVRRSSTLLPFA